MIGAWRYAAAVAVCLCPSGFLLASPPQAVPLQESQPCLPCHETPELFRGREDASALVVTPDSLAESAHGGLPCTACHQELAVPHPDEPPRARCTPCHEDIVARYAVSVHGYAEHRGYPRAPSCTTCHGNHDILPARDPRSPTHKVRVPETCARCHGEAGLRTRELVRLPAPFQAYARSVHGRGTARGMAAAASCADCHAVHDLKGPADPASRIAPQNVAATCGQCHPDIQIDYEYSIHGRALRAGIGDSPTCTDCHGEHLILAAQDPDAPICGARQAMEACGRCHDDPVIVEKYGLRTGVVPTYLDSYHGWASRTGCEIAATCIDCHGAHRVLPADHPESTVNVANVALTCGRCHEGADSTFAASYDHAALTLAENPVNRIVRRIYLILIAGVIGGMVLHNLVILNYYLLKRKEAEEAGPQVVRFTPSELVQHLLLTLSFTVLVVTGFALRFPDAWWVQWLAGMGMDEALRSTVHRIAAVVLLGTGAYHLYEILLTERGRKALRDMIPDLRDLRDLAGNLAFHLRRTSERPRFRRFDYTQKAEYWALVWGTVIMALTGFILWFPTWAARILPALVVPVAQTIHYYEAWLATLAIIVWHLFFVVLHPDVYPMHWAWLTGKIGAASAREHHAAWYEEEIAPLPSDAGVTEGAGTPTEGA